MNINSNWFHLRKIVSCLMYLCICVMGALLLSNAALTNRYPLVCSDTGFYLQLGKPFLHHAVGYNYFILLLNALFRSFWSVVFIQGFITSVLLVQIARALLPKSAISNWMALGILIILALLTELSKYTSWMMPDIATSWLFLGALLSFLSNRSYDRILGVFIYCLSILMHSGNIFLGAALIFTIGIVGLCFRSEFPLYFRKLSALVWSFILSLVLIGSMSMNLTGQFKIFPIGSLNWMMNQFVIHGTMTPVLKRHCPEKRWGYCKYTEEFKKHQGEDHNAHWFMWGDDTPFYSLGGWDNVREPKEIGYYALKDQWWDILRWGTHDTLNLALTVNYPMDLTLGDPINFKTPGEVRLWLLGVFQKYYPREAELLTQSKQWNRKEVRTGLLVQDGSMTYFVSLILGVVVFGISLAMRRYRIAVLLLACLIFVILNAAVMGVLSGPFARYQGRIAWLVTYCALLGFISLFFERKSSSLNSTPHRTICYTTALNAPIAQVDRAPDS